MMPQGPCRGSRVSAVSKINAAEETNMETFLDRHSQVIHSAAPKHRKHHEHQKQRDNRYHDDQLHYGKCTFHNSAP